MNIEIKKDLTSNWFKILQDAICDDIKKFEKNKVSFKSTVWKRDAKKMKVVVNIEYSKMEKFLIKLVSTFPKFMESFQNNFKKIYLVPKKIQDFGHLEFL